ncbi:DUF6293 family protein [Halalkalicoccus tibetensis]|uniref:DUF6293 family protein n=1 Tax=Halalkalicoccus tibetensis TaxID=175632 RepID=A0ABD5V4K1_9EURY
MTDPPIAQRVQIVPLGFEYARLREPIMEWKADRVVLIGHVEDEGITYLEALREELAESDRIELDSRTCDVFDLYDALGAIAGAIADHPDDEVYVNLSAGSKITAIAGMIACMTAGATPIYARPDYGPEGRAIPDEPLHDAVAETFALPAYPIDRPSGTEVAYLAFLADADGEGEGRYRGASKKELIAFGEEEGFEFIARSNASTRKGLYRVLDTHVIDPLSERGYIRVEAVGRTKYVSLTEDGENALRAFAHAR